ncbi:MAG: diacylglycerol kinase family lipid kinase [Myxococcota bacterium]|nr:diacylglycerol kinase family lipid kinase [Myxococcota bacterium]
MSAPVFRGKLATLIANPAAAGGRVGREWPALQTRIRDALGAELECLWTERPGHGAILAQKAVERGAKTVISLGGDGTHHELLNGIMNAGDASDDVRMGVLHAGTGGDFRRVLHGGGDFDSALKRLPTAGSFHIDVGSVSYVSDDGKPEKRFFLNLASAGLAGVVDRMVNSSGKKLGGKLTFLLATLRGVARYVPAEIRLTVDGTQIGDRVVTNVVIANAPWAGGGMMFAPSARLADGLLEIIVFKATGLITSLLLAPKLYSGTHVDTDHVEVFRGREIQIEPLGDEAVLLDIDGESPGRLPARYEIHPRALRLLDLNPEWA